MVKGRVTLVFLLFIFALYGCSAEQNDVPQTENIETSTFDESENMSEEPAVSLIDLFVDSYNKIAETPISDLFDIYITDKKSEYYRTEFRLIAYKDAPAKRGAIGKSTIDIINFGATSKDSIRIYISSDSYEAMKNIFEQSVLSFDGGAKEEGFQDVYDKTDATNGVSFLLGDFNGYYEKSGALYTLMVDFGKVEK